MLYKNKKDCKEEYTGITSFIILSLVGLIALGVIIGLKRCDINTKLSCFFSRNSDKCKNSSSGIIFIIFYYYL